MSLTYKGKPLRRLLNLGTKIMGKQMYFVETSEVSCVVPDYAIGADEGVGEVIRVATRTRGNMIQGERQ
jgi:hypothetical protein